MRVELIVKGPTAGGETLADAALQVMLNKMERFVRNTHSHQRSLDIQWQAKANRPRHSPEQIINVIFVYTPDQHSPAPHTVCMTYGCGD